MSPKHCSSLVATLGEQVRGGALGPHSRPLIKALSVHRPRWLRNVLRRLSHRLHFLVLFCTCWASGGKTDAAPSLRLGLELWPIFHWLVLSDYMFRVKKKKIVAGWKHWKAELRTKFSGGLYIEISSLPLPEETQKWPNI